MEERKTGTCGMSEGVAIVAVLAGGLATRLKFSEGDGGGGADLFWERKRKEEKCL